MTMNSAISFECVLRAWHAHEAELRGFLVKRLGDVDSADDVLQDTFLKAMRLGKDFCRIDQPRAWLFRVVRNALVDRSRLARPHLELPDNLAGQEDSREPVDQLDACVLRNLAEMSIEDRHILQQCDLEGVRQQDFAIANGLSLPATKSRLKRARQRLRETMVRNCKVQFDDSGQVCCHVPRN